MDVLALIFPREKKFYRMVEKQVSLVADAVADFHEFVIKHDKLTPSAKKKYIDAISRREKEDDELYIEMVRALKSTFITPIDREDLHRLVSTFDMIIDSVEILSFKIGIYKIDKIDKEIKTQTTCIFKSFQLIKKLIFSIRNEGEVEKYCTEIRRLEQEGDRAFITGLEKLFLDSRDVMTIIKFKDLYSTQEKVIDKIHEASLIIENVAVKYS